MNMDKMSHAKRSLLMRPELSLADLCTYRDDFITCFERLSREDEASLPKLSDNGWWMQAYGFSKALLNAYTRILAQQHPALHVNACTPGFVATDMTSNYADVTTLKTAAEGSDTPAFLVLAPASDVKSA
jgi:hypothetical protein